MCQFWSLSRTDPHRMRNLSFQDLAYLSWPLWRTCKYHQGLPLSRLSSDKAIDGHPYLPLIAWANSSKCSYPYWPFWSTLNSWSVLFTECHIGARVWWLASCQRCRSARHSPYSPSMLPDLCHLLDPSNALQSATQFTAGSSSLPAESWNSDRHLN